MYLAFDHDGDLDEQYPTLDALQTLIRLDLLDGADAGDLAELAAKQMMRPSMAKRMVGSAM